MALELAAFGWRMNREISLGDSRRRTWLPIPDLINIACFAAVVFTCVVNPIAHRANFTGIRFVVALAATAIAFHPINMAAHYRLFSRKGRTIYDGTEIPLITDQEWRTLAVTCVSLLFVAWYVQ